MERKNIVLFGQHKRNDLLLQMIAEYRLIDNMFTYQIVNIPDKGYVARKLDPQLKDVTYREAIEKADKMITLEELPVEVGILMLNKQLVFWKDILDKPTLAHATPVAVNLKYGEEWFPEVLKKLAEVSQAGYRFQLRTRDESLKSILTVLRNETESDICIWLDPQIEYDFQADLFEKTVRESARKCMSDEKYLERIISFYKKKWKRNIFELNPKNREKVELFFSCSRKYVTLHGEQKSIYEALKFGDKEKLLNIRRKELENFTSMCNYEALKAEHFEKLLNSKTVNIDNLNHVILSYPGSRRCNRKDADCFSNHTCEEQFWKVKMEYKEFFKEIDEEGKKGNLQPLFTMLQPLDYAGRFFIRTFLADRIVVKRCGAGEHIFSVADDGRVYPCDSFNGVECKEIANLQVGIHNRHGFEVPYVTEDNFGCRDCWARYLCGGVCQYVQHLNNYMTNEATKIECELAKFLIGYAVEFWKNARETWQEEDLQKVETHIYEIGFEKMKTKDAFIYAPC